MNNLLLWISTVHGGIKVRGKKTICSSWEAYKLGEKGWCDAQNINDNTMLSIFSYL